MTPERRLDILTRTRDLIADRRRWGQGTLVQHPLVDRLTMRPQSYCLMGAIMVAATGELEYTAEVWEINDYLIELIPERDRPNSPYGKAYTIMGWNDQHEHHEVIALLDLASLETSLGCSHLVAPSTARSLSLVDVSNPASPVVVR